MSTVLHRVAGARCALDEIEQLQQLLGRHKADCYFEVDGERHETSEDLLDADDGSEHAFRLIASRGLELVIDHRRLVAAEVRCAADHLTTRNRHLGLGAARILRRSRPWWYLLANPLWAMLISLGLGYLALLLIELLLDGFVLEQALVSTPAVIAAGASAGIGVLVALLLKRQRRARVQLFWRHEAHRALKLAHAIYKVVLLPIGLGLLTHLLYRLAG